MIKMKQITIRVHGLGQHKDAVDAAVFAQKLAAFVRALRKSDQNGNGRRCLDFLISDLKMGSATAEIVEREADTRHPAKVSGIASVHAALVSVYNGRAIELNGSINLIPAVKALCKGANKSFSHIEIILDTNSASAVRIDNFFEKQLQTATEQLATEEEKSKQRLFRGVSLGTFDGTLKMVDHRGAVKLAKLVLTAGGNEIECAYNEQIAPVITPAFDKRVVIEAWAHYDGTTSLPNRLEVRTAKVLNDKRNLSKWKGAFVIPSEDEEW
jgi:hypothetical protein